MPRRTGRGPVHRVLMTTDAVGGVWTYSLTLAAALGERGVQVTLACLGPAPSDAQRAAARRVTGARLQEHHGRLEWMETPWDDVSSAGEWLLSLAARERPDVVHLNGYTHAALRWKAPTVVVGHSCVLSWWRAVRGTPPPLDVYGRYAVNVRRGLAAASMVLAPTGAMLSSLQADYGPLRRSAVLHNGSDVGAVPVVKEPFVLAAGRVWDQAKNITALDEIAPTLSWPVFVAGEDRQPDGGRLSLRHARGLGLLAPRDLAAWMGRAAIYALPARYEPFGLTVLEAARARCALVLGDIPTLRELWTDAAVFVSPHDRGALHAAVEELTRDDEKRERLADAARRHARRMTARRMATQYLRMYTDLVSGAHDAQSGSSRVRRKRSIAASAPARDRGPSHLNGHPSAR